MKTEYQQKIDLKRCNSLVLTVNLLQEWIVETSIAFADETPLQVLHEPNRRPQNTSYMWCFIGRQSDRTAIVYQYHPSRSGQIPRDFFEGFKGALHCDGYAGYNALLEEASIVGINCMAHVRRKFFEALPNGKLKGISGQVMRDIQALYRIESDLKEAAAPLSAVFEARQQYAKPILNQLNDFLKEKKSSVLPQSPLGKAIDYALKRWHYLTTYLQDGRYEIDNNRAERAIKPFVIGRKNWLFSNTPSGAHSTARLYTLIETVKANGIQPERYLNHLFKELPYCSTLNDYENLLPWNLKPKLNSS